MQKIFITGSRGQLGNDCLRIFGDGFVVEGVDLPEVDLSDRAQCRAALDRIKPNLIVNCAAFTAVDACETDPSCWKANRDLPGHLAEWCREHDAFLIHVSTDYVYPGDKPLFQALEESEEPHPISEYGKSKWAGERAVAENAGSYAILRTAWLYGAQGNNFLKTMLRLTLQHPGKPFKVVNDQWGSPTWSLSLAKQIRAISEQRATGIFHASSEGWCTWYDLACAFLDQLGVEHHFVPCTSEEFPTPTRRPQNSILENAHAKALGINVFRDWKEELSDFVKQHGAQVKEEVGRSE
ncbi:dTDP-4-dehydrorhamnose reductase [Pontiella sp.]|uniref:dTDP-4-dehydrorhamnose reductase n=1 Tax=Pontiella sp. TaxID=2837462 RepID=UPI003567628C